MLPRVPFPYFLYRLVVLDFYFFVLRVLKSLFFDYLFSQRVFTWVPGQGTYFGVEPLGHDVRYYRGIVYATTEGNKRLGRPISTTNTLPKGKDVRLIHAKNSGPQGPQPYTFAQLRPPFLLSIVWNYLHILFQTKVLHREVAMFGDETATTNLTLNITVPSKAHTPCMGTRPASPPTSPRAGSTPKDTHKHGLPVLVFVHGGSWTVGSGSHPIYDPTTLCHEQGGDCIIVSINYRLGVFGWLKVGNSMNRGLQDQITALRWVKDNIWYFGGNPNKITVLGESAGAISTSLIIHATNVFDVNEAEEDKEKGVVNKPKSMLFQRAITMSGATQCLRSKSDAEETAQRFSKHLLGCECSAEALASALESRPVHEIIAAQQKTSIEMGKAFVGNELGAPLVPFTPVLDGELIVRDTSSLPVVNLRRCRLPDVMCGYTANEFGYFSFLRDPTPKSEEDVSKRVDFYLNKQRRCNDDSVSSSTTIETIAQAYLSAPRSMSEQTTWDRMNSDYAFVSPCYRAMHMHHTSDPNATIYLYRFEKHFVLDSLLRGASHTVELGYTFGTTQSFQAICGTGREVEELGAQWRAGLLSFVRHGTPGSAWPSWSPESRNIMVIGANNSSKCVMRKNEDDETKEKETLGLWTNLAPKCQMT
eukprot:PhM_4_TR18854/c0_g1_i1/m.43478/K03929/pnbA; para-nitrobenzyl esterase